jgi:signal transduction histidine kinase
MLCSGAGAFARINDHLYNPLPVTAAVRCFAAQVHTTSNNTFAAADILDVQYTPGLNRQFLETKYDAVLYGVLAIALLLCVIALLYARTKNRQLADLKMQLARKEEQLKMEQFLQRQDDQVRMERDAAVMEQRRKISRDLHDGLSGALAALKYYINDIRLHRREPAEQKMLQDIEDEVNAIYVQVRDYMHRLYHGQEAHEIDLNLFLHSLVTQFSGSTGAFSIRIITNEKEIAERLDLHRQTQLYFIIKEGITNAIKYAGSATITIAIWFQETLCAFRISDDGAGMPGNIAKGVGLNSIADRVQALNGRFKIDSAARQGTSLEGFFPV